MKTCKTCKFRNEEGICSNGKFADNVSWYNDYDATEEESIEHDEKVKDMLLYSYNEGGSFFVGENFWCVHYEKNNFSMTSEQIVKAIKIERKAWTLEQIAKRFKISHAHAGVIILELQDMGALTSVKDTYNRYLVT